MVLGLHRVIYTVISCVSTDKCCNQLEISQDYDCTIKAAKDARKLRFYLITCQIKFRKRTSFWLLTEISGVSSSYQERFLMYVVKSVKQPSTLCEIVENECKNLDVLLPAWEADDTADVKRQWRETLSRGQVVNIQLTLHTADFISNYYIHRLHKEHAIRTHCKQQIRYYLTRLHKITLTTEAWFVNVEYS